MQEASSGPPPGLMLRSLWKNPIESTKICSYLGIYGDARNIQTNALGSAGESIIRHVR